MLQRLQLLRPLAVLDLETTGTDPAAARVVEIAVIKLLPTGERIEKSRRLDPREPIPPEATAVHGITDADVAGAPTFRQVARGLADFLAGCDLCGFNLPRYDLRVLHHEFRRAGVVFDLSGRAIVDVMAIYHKLHPRDLSAAVRQYCGRDHDGAHGAAADAAASLDVLEAMLLADPTLPSEPRSLYGHFRDPGVIDSGGFFGRVNGEVRFRQGKYRGQPLAAIAATAPDYLRWMMAQDFFDDTKAVVAGALA